MSHGGLPPRRPDQQDDRTPRIPVPGARTTPIINKPGTVVTVQDGGVPGIKSASSLQQGFGTQTLVTLAAAGRIWGGHLSYAITTASGYAGGTVQIYARLFVGTAGITLTVVELAISAASQSANGDSDLSIPGIVVAGGDTIKLDVNGGAGVANAVLRASAVVLYSVP